ncbi:hypothetical protein SFA32_12405 [Buttiauxella sp. HR94]|nr:hypothetical protein SFA32_12405 [Buttiauxella sp. HR94]
MKLQLAKVYEGGRFKGYAVAVDGQILSNQVSTTIESTANDLPVLKAVFFLEAEQAENPICIEV